MKEKKLYLKVLVSFENGNGSIDVFRDKKVETKSELIELTELLRENNPDLKKITNILYFKNK